MSRMSFNYKNYNIIVVVVLARDILACFAGKSTESNRAFYEFMIYRNVQYHGDSRQQTTGLKINYFPEITLKISSLKMFQFI